MGSRNFNKIQVGLQTAHGTAVDPTVQVPAKGTYEDKTEKHSADYDAGTWTETEIVADVAYGSAVKVTGEAFFEDIPIWLNSGFEDVAPSGTYIHTYAISPAAVAVPKPLTAMLGEVGNNLGATGPAVKIKDLYTSKLTLAGNMNTKVIKRDVTLFGAQVDDNSGAGYAFASVGLIATPQMMKVLQGTFKIDDAGTTGGAFTTMTSFATSLLDWSIDIDTGIAPCWTGDGNSLNFGSLRYGRPKIEFKPVIRTSATNYALVRAKWAANTYQEIELTIAGTSASLVFQLTGRWTACPTVHDTDNDEVVMKPTFTAKTSHLQTTTPHYATIVATSSNNWT